ncbi:TonB-dependent receptor plug domain-containing protein [Sphingomonas sp.]|jgi:outer membrane receptor protein involved in Fe transport|uniref:TonB-dependent receptor plug domain-containing protein n=1 Tax=Sphingomonas sp. TaxID=28214 RepID=UPI002ED97817
MIRSTPLLAFAALLATPAAAQTARSDLLVFPASFFAEAQPATAYDMVLRIPGFAFDAGDSEVRGLAGSGGNVLIDGRRSAAKGDTLDAILKRIPAAAVLRIELIRGGANGVDMQGAPLLANVVRRRETAVRAQAEASFSYYGDGRTAPSVRANISRRRGDAQTEGSFYLYQSVDDEKGRGPRTRINPDGSLRERALYDERDGFRGGEFSAGHEQPLAGGRLQLTVSLKRDSERADTDLLFLAPSPGLEEVLELETKDNAEIGLAWSRRLGRQWSLELSGLQRFSLDDASERSDDGSDVEEVAADARGGESIVRALLRWQRSEALSFEGGAEAAYNYLDSHSALAVNNVAVALPAANVRVAERRAEGFASAIWHPSHTLSVEAGLRVETSRLVQTGDSNLAKSFVFAKPRLAFNWSAGARTQWRARIERDASQLDFGDFVSSTSLTSGTTTAGNADLEPQRVWTATLAWERRFWNEGALVLTARREWISHTVDRIGVFGPGFAFDAPGNIGTAAKAKIEASLSLPLNRLGIAGGLLKLDAGYRWTSVIDPTTRLRRSISGEQPIDGEVHFTQDRPAIGFRWGADMILAETETEYRFNEVRRSHIGARVSAFAEVHPAAHWTLRAFAENITGRDVRRDRFIYAGARSAQLLRYSETRLLSTQALFGVLIRKDLGGK